MATKLNDKIVEGLQAPQKGNRRVPDSAVQGLHAQVTAAGRRSWVLRYRFHGVETLYTIGDFPDWRTAAARTEAQRLKRLIDQGINPKTTRDEERAAPTVADMAARYEAEHLPGKRPRSANEDRALIRDYILPALGKLKVADVTQADVRKMHRKITQDGKPVRANRVLACVRTMFALATSPDWNMRPDNPARGGTGGVQRNPEDGRERFLSEAEIARLSDVLARHPERTTVALIRFLMMTGCRFGEAANATWDQFDLALGIWKKPSRSTKQKKHHGMPLSAPALALLSERKAETTGSLVFPSPKPSRKHKQRGEHPLTTIQTAWARIRRAAGIEDVRPHDLRHSFASVLAGSGASLQLIGSLLGHAQVSTTQRYAHLADDARRAAVERVGAVLTSNGRPPAEVVPLRETAGR
jgi:integrase